jgi:hypothetical protein
MAVLTRKSAPQNPLDNKARIVRLSRLMSMLCMMVAVILGAGLAIYWVVAPIEGIFRHAGIPGFPIWEIGFGVRLMAFLISAVPLACLIWGLLQAGRCFDVFATGTFFTDEPARHLRAFAIAILVSALLKPFAGAALSLLLSTSSLAGRRAVIVNVSSDMLIAFVIAGLIAVVAWVMAQARTLADENAQFI